MTRGVLRVAFCMPVDEDKTQSASGPTSPESGLTPDVQAIARIDAVKTVLRVLLQTTGLRLAVVARVTSREWRCCAVLDEMGFGLNPGDTLAIATTFCNTVRTSATALLVNHASQEPRFADHPAPRLYGVESYIAVPLYRRDGAFFGVMCALDSSPAELTQDKLEVFRHLGDLIGHQLENQDELDRSEAQLFSEKEAALLREQLLGIVSHDLRNPLNAIHLSTTQLLHSEALPERERRLVTRIARSSARMTRMISELLDFTRGRLGGGIPVHRTAGDLRAVVRQGVEELEAAWPERTLRVAGGNGRYEGQWDADRLLQVVSNLGGNALQYSAADAPVTLTLSDQGDTVVLEVHNPGEPIAPDALPHLFDPFRRATNSHQVSGNSGGLGLGLYIVEQVVKGHGGHIEVTSTLESGTVFRVTLPRAPPPPA